MARFFRRLIDFKRNRNSSPNSRLNPCSSPQTSDRTKSPCEDPRSCSPSLPTSLLSSRKLDSSARWSKEYDVCVCHTEDDIMYVQDLVSFLELHPHSLRCFLQLRDATPGGAVCTELCQAVRESHCWVLVITPSFLKDPWCRYQMQQALSESPTANGRIIPVRKQLERKDYPLELRFMFGIDVRQDKENGFQKIKCAIMHYLEELSRTESDYRPRAQDDPEFNMDTASGTLNSSGNC
ncbi:toll/interleukin-1 receptor domain-containing adapter protein [Rhincodon typus]|uniref:toll/interleukin-1 receptor domain-containing adapter protein n=1 Tax=Rhincodon typus TaxID=259920 RepID=UPI0009A311C5|nr:toll/interleukin-1 receptor domain-containing adapter protein [Rhincodon typus]XP_048471270.1 toll/interleukin-1 receptor domain-containing adapter protein [Rhincodon typus]XP_048471271.1 toll/interleukin-1 receptor domain-containing adapter protein [Rhincodon typus]XP_048471272.1 toll/interleukin-1 receptor domain-containing adapter protein [Rhincodon typus]